MAYIPASQLSDAELYTELQQISNALTEQNQALNLDPNLSRSQERAAKASLKQKQAALNQRMQEIRTEGMTNPARIALKQQWETEQAQNDKDWTKQVTNTGLAFGAMAGGAALAGGFSGAGAAGASGAGTAVGGDVLAGTGYAGGTAMPAAAADLTAYGAGASGTAGAFGGSTAAGTAGGSGGTLAGIGSGAAGTAGGSSIWGPIIQGGGAIVGGLIANKGAGDAADAQERAAALATAEQRRQYDLTRADWAPFRETGVAANARLRQLLGLDAGYSGADSGSLARKFSLSDLNADPVYQSGLDFGLKEGTGGINARALAGGNYDSGATLKALTRFGNDYASTKGNEAYNRYNTSNDAIYNKYAGVSGVGQNATQAVTSAGTNMANNVSNNITDAGNARAAGIVGKANAWGNTLSGMNDAYNNYESNKTLRSLRGY